MLMSITFWKHYVLKLIFAVRRSLLHSRISKCLLTLFPKEVVPLSFSKTLNYKARVISRALWLLSLWTPSMRWYWGGKESKFCHTANSTYETEQLVYRKKRSQRTLHYAVNRGVVVLPFRGTLTSWRKGLTENLWSSSKGNANPCTLGRITSGTSTGWRPTSWKAALQEEPWGCWWMPSWTRASNVPLQQRRPTAPWAVLGEVLPAGWGRWSCPSTQLYWDASGCCVQLWAPQYMPDWIESCKGPQRWPRDWSTCHMRGWENWGCLGCRREGSGISLISVH